MVDERHLTGPPLTAEYEPPSQSFVNFLYDPNRPIFVPQAVDSMLTDPRVRLGLAMRRGPILSNSRFFVHCDKNPEAKQFIATQINRFWYKSAPIALRNTHYGYQPSEAIFRSVDGQLQYDRLRHVHPRDAQARTLKGCFVGFDVGGIQGREVPLFIGCPKAFWSVHNRSAHRWYGQSLLYGAFPPWYEKWARRGFRDARQMFYYRYAFRGPVVKYPQGAQPPAAGSAPGTPPRDNRYLAQEMGDKWAAGATVTLPSTDPTKGAGWEIDDPVSLAAPDGLMEYGRDLNDEILEGMEIPPEIAAGARASGDGISIGGGGGRDIPMQAYFSILSEDAYSLITDFDEQILAPMVSMRWGKDLFYEIECFGLLRGQDQDTEPGAMEQAHGEETANMGGNELKTSDSKGEIQMSLSDHGRPPIIQLYNDLEEKKIARHYRRISDYQFRMRRA